MSEEVGRDMTGEADGMNQGVDSRDGVVHLTVHPTEPWATPQMHI